MSKGKTNNNEKFFICIKTDIKELINARNFENQEHKTNMFIAKVLFCEGIYFLSVFIIFLLACFFNNQTFLNLLVLPIPVVYAILFCFLPYFFLKFAKSKISKSGVIKFVLIADSLLGIMVLSIYAGNFIYLLVIPLLLSLVYSNNKFVIFWSVVYLLCLPLQIPINQLHETYWSSFQIYQNVSQFILFVIALFIVGLIIIIANKMQKQYYQQLKLISYEHEKSKNNQMLELSSDIQQSMLPSNNSLNNMKEIDVFGYMKPAIYVAGDYYDYLRFDDIHLGIIVADVSGKGVASGLFMAKAKSIIARCLLLEKSLDIALKRANNELCSNNEHSYFLTCWVGMINLQTGELEYCNAGHEAPVIYSNNVAHYLEVDSGFVLGGIPDLDFKLQNTQLNIGDFILLYTDGVTEAENIDEQMFGKRRLLDAFCDMGTEKTSEQLVSNVKDSVSKFVGAADQADDITMLGIKLLAKKKIERFFVSATLDSLKEISVALSKEFDKNRISESIQSDFQIVLEELFVNIVYYAYSEHQGNILFTFEISSDKISCVLSDWGIAFNPLEKENPDVTLDAKDRSIGGLGIYLTKDIMDNVEYKRTNGMNTIRFEKFINKM